MWTVERGKDQDTRAPATSWSDQRPHHWLHTGANEHSSYWNYRISTIINSFIISVYIKCFHISPNYYNYCVCISMCVYWIQLSSYYSYIVILFNQAEEMVNGAYVKFDYFLEFELWLLLNKQMRFLVTCLCACTSIFIVHS